MQTDQYRTEPTDPFQRAAWMRMIWWEAHQHEAMREYQRHTEDEILACAEGLEHAYGDIADYYRAVADQIRDHRAAGNYTTMHR